MKILHTADWHLGKKLDRFSRLAEQREVLQEIIEIADREQVDLILIAGDLFDTFNPAAEAVELFYKTLKKLTADGKRPVIAIAGNHDSPNLIDAPDPLARECGILLIGQPKAVVSELKLENFEIINSGPGLFEIQLKYIPYPVRVLHTAYANEVRLKEYFGEAKEQALNKVLAENWKQNAEAFCDEKGVNILITHLYMNKRGENLLEEPDGERPIKVGNADLVYSDAVPPQIQYVALGHLHGHRNIGTEKLPVVYSSSLLPYSFSEAGHQKGVTIVEVEPCKPAVFKNIELQQGKKLHRKTFTSVDAAEKWLTENPDALVELTIESDTYLNAGDQKRLHQAHSGIVYIIPKITRQAGHQQSVTVNLGQEILPLFKDYFRSKNNGQDPNEDILALFNEIQNAAL